MTIKSPGALGIFTLPKLKDMPKLINLLGNRYTRWTVIGPYFHKKNATYWRCRCDCGTISDIETKNLRKGTSKSCGCLKVETAGTHRVTHGESDKTKEYRTWVGIKDRCSTNRPKHFKTYKSRGITVCDRWLESYENFLQDMGRAPSPKHSIERKDNDKGYSPDNCIWGTPKQQANNTSRSKIIEFNGQTMTLKLWADRLDMSYPALWKRIHDGWSIKKTFTKPVKIGSR